MAQILQPYELSISSVENSPKEVLLDLFYSLERLKSTTDDIFGKIEKRVVDERDRGCTPLPASSACRYCCS